MVKLHAVLCFMGVHTWLKDLRPERRFKGPKELRCKWCPKVK